MDFCWNRNRQNVCSPSLFTVHYNGRCLFCCHCFPLKIWSICSCIIMIIGYFAILPFSLCTLYGTSQCMSSVLCIVHQMSPVLLFSKMNGIPNDPLPPFYHFITLWHCDNVTVSLSLSFFYNVACPIRVRSPNFLVCFLCEIGCDLCVSSGMNQGNVPLSLIHLIFRCRLLSIS